ncbi:MAG: LysR family transcriptional regulator [Rhizobiaceae bacterium]|nr:LysR family transcriptional regulator [Rhizobiaceae bacterium]
MEINQIKYFLNLAATLNFTEAARRSGVAQPSLTRSIRRLEEELGGLLIYRDGKDSRLTDLGREVQAEFMRIDTALMNIREHSENSVRGRRRVLDIGVATTIAPAGFSGFFDHTLSQLPAAAINVHPLEMKEGADAVLSGKYHACLLPVAPADNPKLSVLPLFTERFMLACAESYPLATLKTIPAEEIARHSYVDRLACEFHGQITEYFMNRDIVMYPRFRSEREDWVQRMVADGHAICIMPERSAILHGLVTRPVENLDLSREVVLVTVSGSGTPIEIRQIARLAAKYDWGRD